MGRKWNSGCGRERISFDRIRTMDTNRDFGRHWIVAAAILLALLLAVRDAQASSFQSDRGWSGPRADRIGRVYVGMSKVISYGPGWNVETYINRAGTPDERRTASATDEVLIYRGKKALYRGTREDNTDVGLEWREIRVRSGMLIEEAEAVQVIEFLDRPGVLTCETYGSRNTLQCLAIEPVEPMPAMSAAPAAVGFDFSCPKNAVEPPRGKRGLVVADATVVQSLVAATLRATQDEEVLFDGSSSSEPPGFFLGTDLSPAHATHDEADMIRRCSISTELRLFAQSNEVGRMLIGICDRKELAFVDICAAKALLTRTVYKLQLNPADGVLQSMGIPPQAATLPSGDIAEYFSTIAVGHGIGFMRTSILHPAANQHSVIIQSYLDNLCDRMPKHRLCTNTRAVFEDVEKVIVERLFEK